MKRIAYIFFALLLSCTHAQQVERLNPAKIEENVTPRAVAYNFVTSIITEEYATAFEQMTDEYFFQLMPALIGEGIPPSELFSSQYTHKIVDMRPVVQLGYEVVLTECKELKSETFFDDESNYKGLPASSVSFTCVDSQNKRYDGSRGQYDTEVTILLVRNEENKWKVLGFE